MHINDIYDSYELNRNSTSKKFLLVQQEGIREVKRNIQYYNLYMVISVGYKVNEIARDKALTEFEKYRIKQDKLYKSDFDLLLEEIK